MSAGMDAIGKMLLENECLTELDLGWNICGPCGAAALFRSLIIVLYYDKLSHIDKRVFNPAVKMVVN